MVFVIKQQLTAEEQAALDREAAEAATARERAAAAVAAPSNSNNNANNDGNNNANNSGNNDANNNNGRHLRLEISPTGKTMNVALSRTVKAMLRNLLNTTGGITHEEGPDVVGRIELRSVPLISSNLR